MTNEPLGAGCLPVGITCSDQADEKPVTPIRLSFPDKPLAGRRPEWPIPLQLFGCFYEPDSWLGLEEGLLKSVDRFFSPIWSESCLGRRIETRVDGFFGTSERYKFIDKAFQDAVKRRKPLYRNAQGILSKEKKEGFAPVRDNSEEYMDILAEALKAHFTRQFSPQVGESCEGYYAWHRQGLLVKSTANRELNPDKTVVLFVERACDEFIEEFGLDKLKLKRDIQKNLYKGSGSELSQFYNQEVIALKDLTGDWHRDTKIVEQSLLLQDMVVSIESFCGPIAACDETSKGLYFAKIWSLLASCLSAWAKESAKTLDCDLLKGFVHKALGAFREQESAAFFAMGPGLSTKRVISTRHFALYLDAEEDRPLVIRSYDSHTGILVIRAEADKAYLLVNSPSEKKVKDLLRRYEKPHYAQTCEWVESNKLRVHRGDVIVVAGCARVEIR